VSKIRASFANAKKTRKEEGSREEKEEEKRGKRWGTVVAHEDNGGTGVSGKIQGYKKRMQHV
jgi:hypothetical protein